MYTSFGDAHAGHSAAEPNGAPSTVPSTPSRALKTNVNVDTMSPLPPRMGPPPTSSPGVPVTHTPHSTGVSHAHAQPSNSWPIDSLKDGHLSASEPRIYPGMISRRQRTNSLRQSSMHESDDRASAKMVVAAVEESDEGSRSEKN